MITAESIREMEARVLLAAAKMEHSTRLVTVDALRDYLHHHEGCDDKPCACGLSGILAILEVDPFTVRS